VGRGLYPGGPVVGQYDGDGVNWLNTNVKVVNQCWKHKLSTACIRLVIRMLQSKTSTCASSLV